MGLRREWRAAAALATPTGGGIAFRRTFGRLKTLPSPDDLLSLHVSGGVSRFFRADGADNVALKINPPGAFGEIPLVVAAIAIFPQGGFDEFGFNIGHGGQDVRSDANLQRQFRALEVLTCARIHADELSP